MILSVGLCEDGALHLALRSAPSAKLNLILAKFYEVLIFAPLCIKTKWREMVPTTNIENNYKTFYTLQRAYLQNQDLTLLENIQLLLLAYQCPFTDGQVVYNARALYNLVNQTIVVYNDNNCSKRGFSFRELNDSIISNTPEEEELLQQLIVNEKTSKEKFKYASEYVLFPNPAYNEFSIFSNLKQENLQITITDVNGKVLISKKLATENYSTKLNFNLINGIYFVNIVNEQGEKTVKKLVVAN
ncbi:MAG: T9SS type A sorting domain-containing protein [Bacteroidetes bacterium]|nr:T9SS type A sorting domain-containing protein [Bacteroidota bacterium]